MKKRWLSLARNAEVILGNFAVVGLAMAVYQKEVWPALPIAAVAVLFSLIISWVVPHD